MKTVYSLYFVNNLLSALDILAEIAYALINEY